jgi:hypothetical protein
MELSPSPSALRRGDVSVIIYKTSTTRLQEHDTPTGGGGRRGSGAPFLSVFLFLLFPSLSHVPQILPLVYKREGWAPHLGKLFKLLGFGDFKHSETLQLHFTFTRDLGLLPSLIHL